MYCKNCGSLNMDGSLYCYACGERLDGKEKPLTYKPEPAEEPAEPEAKPGGKGLIIGLIAGAAAALLLTIVLAVIYLPKMLGARSTPEKTAELMLRLMDEGDVTGLAELFPEGTTKALLRSYGLTRTDLKGILRENMTDGFRSIEYEVSGSSLIEKQDAFGLWGGETELLAGGSPEFRKGFEAVRSFYEEEASAVCYVHIDNTSVGYEVPFPLVKCGREWCISPIILLQFLEES